MTATVQAARTASLEGDQRIWLSAGSALLRSGMLTASPLAVVRMARMLWRHGASTATPFAIAAARFPDREAMIDDDGALSFRNLYDHAFDLAATIHRRRGPVSSVAVLCRNHRGFAIAFAAAAMLGAEVILVNTEQTQDQLAALLSRHDPDVLIHDREYAPALERIDSACHLVASESDTSGSTRTVSAPKGFVAARRPNKLTLLTSGTTGLAKSVPRSTPAWGIVQVAATGLATIGLRSSDRVWVGPPFFHGFGILALLGAVAAGATTICRRKFDAATAADDLTYHRATVLIAVPVMIQRLLDLPDIATLARRMPLRLAATGAAPIPSGTVTGFQEIFGPILVNGYGSTEAGIVTLASAQDLADSPGTVGRPGLGVAIRLLGDDESPVPDGEPGRILVRGPLGYEGYTPDPDRSSSQKKVVDGFVDTGDVGVIDSAGRLTLLGRSDDMVISGGENIFPGEVEDILAEHDIVSDAVVLGIPDKQYGQVLHAFVVLDKHAEAEENDIDGVHDELTAYARHHLERYKTPKKFHIVGQIPRNPSGKVLRRDLITRITAETEPRQNT